MSTFSDRCISTNAQHGQTASQGFYIYIFFLPLFYSKPSGFFSLKFPNCSFRHRRPQALGRSRSTFIPKHTIDRELRNIGSEFAILYVSCMATRDLSGRPPGYLAYLPPPYRSEEGWVSDRVFPLSHIHITNRFIFHAIWRIACAPL